jgi:poly(beta-D-mannuronate) lyase
LSINKAILSFLYSCLLLLQTAVNATNYTVSTKTDLQTRMVAAVPGDTVTVANGTYNNWGNISFANNNGTSTSAWIVLRAQSFKGVVFTGTTSLQFSGKHILITGFRYANGSSGGSTDLIQFRTSSTVFASYCRLNNIIIDAFNSDSTGSVAGISPDTDNKWVSLFGTNNRVDHCTFINKFNAGATVVVWYDNNTYPQQSTPTLHRIDSNYFKGRGYQGENGGESMRLGTSTTSRTNGYNIVEYNYFEDCTQVEPEIISNKSNFNTYRYNTFKNCYGGMTMRHGRFCTIYSNFFIVDNAAVTKSYGIRLIDKGHKVYNNYLEGLLGNKNSLTALRCPIILYNGLASTNDTTDASKAAGYFPADSSIIAFNTIVNCSGGAGIVLGFTDGGDNTFQPKGIIVANNLIKMTTGQTVLKESSNTSLTYTAEGNVYQAPNGLGISPSTGFTSNAIIFGARTNGILAPPSLVQDAAINTANYTSLLSSTDAQGEARSATYDIGADEINGTGTVVAYPLDSNLVGAGKPQIVTPVHLIGFKVLLVNKNAHLTWNVSNEINFKQYNVEWSNDGKDFSLLSIINAQGTNASTASYNYQHINLKEGKYFYRLKMIDKDGSFEYSPVRFIAVGKSMSANIYPNPAQQFVTVDLNGTVQPQTEIILFDATGKIVKQAKATSNSIEISLKGLSTGMYHLSVMETGKAIANYPLMIRY